VYINDDLYGYAAYPYKVAENRDFDGKETLIVKRAVAISKRVLG